MWDFINDIRRGPEDMCQTWDEAVVLMGLVFARKPHKILEIGVRTGGSAVLMAEALAHLVHHGFVPKDVHIDAVDAEGDLRLSSARHHLKKYINMIKVHSPEGVPEGKIYDLIHIDGAHYYEAVQADLKVAFEHSHPGTAIIMHDANYPGVRQAVDEFAEQHPEAFVSPNWTKRTERKDDWGGQALIVFKE